MSKPKLNSVEMPATDLDQMKSFYESNFGWTFTDYGPTYCAALVSGVEVGFNAEATVSPAQPNGSENATGPLVLMQTEDLAAVHADLSDGGAVIVTKPFDFPGGSRLHFRDPSGNVVGIYEYELSGE